MKKISEYKYLIGWFSGGEIEIENTPEKLAEFICEAGKYDDLVISTPRGQRVLNTYGIYIDRCCDSDFLQSLLQELIPRQLEEGEQAGLQECHCSQEPSF